MDKKKTFSQDMNLHSPSGYAMPFEADERTPLEITLGYGEQVNPYTGENFLHSGVDFKVRPGTWLKALATGVVTGISTDVIHGFRITVNYPNYADRERSSFDVTYSHISESLCNFGKSVKAGENIAKSDGLLHIEVKFNGEEINPLEFLAMVRDNLVMQAQMQMSGNNPEIATLDFDVHTRYDAQQEEIDQLMYRYFGSYMGDMFFGRYRVSDKTESSLREAIVHGARSGAYYEHAPSMLNPLGLGQRSYSIIGQIQELLIGDFLNYLALKHSVFLSSMTELEKKKLLTGL